MTLPFMYQNNGNTSVFEDCTWYAVVTLFRWLGTEWDGRWFRRCVRGIHVRQSQAMDMMLGDYEAEMGEEMSAETL